MKRPYKYGGPTKGLRFGILARVSTEKQAARGQSLKVQVDSMTEAVQTLGGVATPYTGQEHGTPNPKFERKKLAQLLADAEAGLLDAVMVADYNRWSRGNKEATEGLDRLMNCGCRFFVKYDETNLESPDDRMSIGVLDVVARHVVAMNLQKAQRSRIFLALKRWPIYGPSKTDGIGGCRLPYGRTITNPNERRTADAVWSVDERKAKKANRVAQDYLKGATWEQIEEKHHEPGTTWLRRIWDAGDTWELPFKRMGIKPDDFRRDGKMPEHLRFDESKDELVVTIPIPRLLDEAVRQSVIEKSKANKLRGKDSPKSPPFPLRGYLKCAKCGSNLNIHHDLKSDRIYAQHHHKTRKPGCVGAMGRLEDLNREVLGRLSAILTDPKAFHDSIASAAKHYLDAKPEVVQEREEVLAEIKSFEAKMQKLAYQLELDLPPDGDALVRARMKEYQQQLDTRRQHVKQLDAALQIVEAPPEVPQLIQFAKKVLQSRKGPSYAGSAWPTEAKRMLLEFFFGIPHRKPMGPGDPLTEPGIYLDRRKGKDGGDELVWEGRGVFGTVDRSGFHGQAMTQQKVFEFFRSYPFADLARKPFGKALGGKLANAVARAGTRAKSCGARSRSIAPR